MKIEKFIEKHFLGLLIFIFLISLSLRIYKLGSLPNSLHQDEIMNGYVGRFIFLNGIDLYGNKWPLIYFDRFGDYPNVLPMYLSGLSTFIFGVNEFAIRFPIALIGSLIIIPIFFISDLIFKDKITALFSSLFIGLMPWHITLSRSTSEGILGSTSFAFALFFLFKALTSQKLKPLVLSFPFFFLSYFLYPAFRLITPLSLLPSLYWFKSENPIRLKVCLLLLLLFFSGLTAYIGTTPWGKGRFNQTSIFNVNSGVELTLKQLIFDEGPNHIIRARIFHNKIIGYSREFIKQYLKYFSPNFLFLQQGLPRRYQIPDNGLLYITSLFFIFLALINLNLTQLSRNLRERKGLIKYGLLILLISPIPAALTIDDTPNIHRSIFLTVSYTLFSSYGFYIIRKNIKRWQPYLYLITLASIFELLYFSHQYINHVSNQQGLYRNDGSKQLILYLKKSQSKYSRIFIPDQKTLALYYLFYTNNFNPGLAGRFKKDIKINHIGKKIIFIDNPCPSSILKPSSLSKNSLIVVDGQCQVTSSFKEIKSIRRTDLTTAFKLLTLK